MHASAVRPWGKTAWFAAGLAVAYAVTGVLGMRLAAPPGNVTAVWLPAGLSLAALLRLGRGVWPGITVGSFLCNLVFFPEGHPAAVRVLGALAIALGSTTGLLCIEALARRAPVEDVLESPAALARFLSWISLGCGINATVGLAATAVLADVPSSPWFWITWWLGDSVGVLLVTPLFLRESAPLPARRAEWALTLGYTLLACQVVFGRPLAGLGGAPLPLAFLMQLGSIWAGVRLGGRGVSVQALVMYPLMSWATLNGVGPFGSWPREAGLMLIDALLMVVAITGLLLAALTGLTRRQQADLERERAQLEARVKERTGQLEASTRSLLEETEVRGRLSAQLIEAQKQEALGRLAGGIAHDFSNLLAVVTGEAELLRRAPGQPAEVLDSAGAILAAGYRAGELTKQLLVVARRQPTTPRHVDLPETLATNRRLLRPLLPESVTLDVVCPERCGVTIDPTLLDQVILNLALNARDAVGTKGEVTIVAERHVLEAAAAGALGLAPGAWVCLRVTDDGVGIAPEVLPRIFEPFFTTKAEGRGTGLGLSTVLGIVTQSHGAVKVSSVPGKTVFSVWLPASDGPFETRALPPPPTRGPEPHLLANILVVEDEPLLRRTLVLALERAGHRTLTAGDGEEALGLLRHPGQRVDLVVTDVVMPRLSGVELARAVRRLLPTTPVIFMSGFHERQAELAEELVLGKPFTAEQLLNAVETKLRERSG